MATDEFGGMLLFTITFLGSFFVMISGGLFPAGFVYSGKEYGEYWLPEDKFGAVEILAYSETWRINYTYPGPDLDEFTLGGWNTRMEWMYNNTWAYTYDYWWIFEWNYQNFKWYKDGSIYSSVETSIPDSGTYEFFDMATLDDGWDPTVTDSTLMYVLKNGNTQYTGYFGWNRTAYDYPSQAYMNDDLVLALYVNWDQANTRFNAWNIISGLLFFQTPAIFGDYGDNAGSLALSFMISLPLWICIGYLIYRLILLAIPFVGG